MSTPSVEPPRGSAAPAGTHARPPAAVATPAPDGDPPRTPTPARLVRSREDRMVAGVAGGLGRYLGVDPVVVRLGFVVLALAGGGGVLAYLVAWLVMPEAPEGEPELATAGGASATGTVLLGAALIALGGLLLLDLVLPAFSWRFVAPLALVLLGVVLLVRRGGDR